ncbi:MAG: 5'-nucleotidase C-terminal domain-containing protein [Elusimicrobiota bacterium]|jgi:2',3'-cyclic-nucleotide 2'-phosphodiesterase (5'-nucleotidase family)|nr:5'-nucleotidase C-terminal domain-containing protein [Elusimicrobiota bacterium]
MKKLIILPLLPLIFCSLNAKDVVIYHTSDTHGYYFAEPDAKGRMSGGFAALASFIKKDKARHKAPYFLFDGGDFMQGNSEANDSKGITSAKLFNALNYDAVAIGNHEFDFGPEALKKVIAALNAKALAANIIINDKVSPYFIFEKDGLKIAVIGIGRNNDAKNKTFRVLDDRESFIKALGGVKRHNPSAIILLVHGSNGDLRPYAASQDIVKDYEEDLAVVLNGHLHKERLQKIRGLLFVDPASNLEKVAKITLSFDKNNKFKKAKAKLISLDVKKTGQDERINALVEEIRNPFYGEHVGQTAEFMPYLPQSEKPKYLDCGVCEFVTDAVKKETGADISIQNTKMFRSFLPKGLVTKREFLKAMPYDNKVTLVKIKGSFIENLILSSVRPDFSAFQFSGLEAKVFFDGEKAFGAEIKINGRAIEREKVYTAAISDYLAFSEENEAKFFSAISDLDKIKTDIGIRQIFQNSLNAQNGAGAPKGKRIKVVYVKNK